LEAFLDSFEQSGLDTALLSSEGFDAFKKNDIGFLASQLSGYQVQPIVVFRHPVHLARSIYCSLGRVSPMRGNKLTEAKAYFSHPGHLIRAIWSSQRRTEKIACTNFILRQAKRRIYDYQGICRDWCALGSVKVFFFERSTDISKDILFYIFQNNAEALKSIADEEIPRLRSALPVPLAMMNNVLYESLGLEKAVYKKHIYPYIVHFAKTDIYRKMDLGVATKDALPFSASDQELLLKKVRNRLDSQKILECIEHLDQERNFYIRNFMSYIEKAHCSEIPKTVVNQVKTEFIKYCLPRKSFVL
jgi:hypothetical protein